MSRGAQTRPKRRRPRRLQRPPRRNADATKTLERGIRPQNVVDVERLGGPAAEAAKQSRPRPTTAAPTGCRRGHRGRRTARAGAIQRILSPFYAVGGWRGGRRGAGARAANPKPLGANAHTKRPGEPIKGGVESPKGATAPVGVSAADRRGTPRVTLDERVDVVRREAAAEMHTSNW